MNEHSSRESSVLRTFSKLDVEDDEYEKAKCVNQQLLIYEKLLETRIKLQKLLTAVNRLPQPSVWKKFQLNCDQFNRAANEASEQLVTLLRTLIELSEHLRSQGNLPFDGVSCRTRVDIKDEDDENIDSDFDEVEEEEEEAAAEEEDEFCNEEEANDDEQSIDEEANEGVKSSEESAELNEEQDLKQRPQKRLKAAEIENHLRTQHERLKSVRNRVIDQWFEKTRYATTAGKVNKNSLDLFEQSTVKVIEHVLSNRERLIKRTQLKRSAYRILGTHDENEKAGDEVDEQQEHETNLDPEIFDDDDFYHQLLRELIDSKTSNANDPISLSRKWLQIQKTRSKLKRKVDTKASKGRKIKYDVHSKLINFMAPFDNCKYTDDAKNELFSSLFGKRKYTIENS
ncbi:protein AATF-like protein [Dinothrombium tinctorium]|uniref:Protein AATF-like protein n=1 Tax=Dinothrombium tinctorium TaxID=1965070 RepID=A0A3S3S705_9ACAR|nr:protein AATF-like protein [Dinothrombium tinctorium]RWS12674.1 protein AATF-like protein [Dinothrombium tinctorium]RWS15041.1 protein AATF-like protein [Dinothrombium tinctorium]